MAGAGQNMGMTMTSESAAALAAAVQESSQYAVVIDGYTLSVALEHFAPEFVAACSKCTSVLCCRTSPAAASWPASAGMGGPHRPPASTPTSKWG